MGGRRGRQVKYLQDRVEVLWREEEKKRGRLYSVTLENSN